MNCLEPKDRKYDRAGIDGSEGVAAGYDEHVLDTVLGWIVVGPKADDRTKSQAKGVEHLKKAVNWSHNFTIFT